MRTIRNLLIVASRHDSDQTIEPIRNAHLKSVRMLTEHDRMVVVDNGSRDALRVRLNKTYARNGIRYISNANWTIDNGWEFGAWRWAIETLPDLDRFDNYFLLQDSMMLTHPLPKYRLHRAMCESCAGGVPECGQHFCWSKSSETCIQMAR